jgi:hypothetical protein
MVLEVKLVKIQTPQKRIKSPLTGMPSSCVQKLITSNAGYST